MTLEDITNQLDLRVNGIAITRVNTPSTAVLLQQYDYLLVARPGKGNVDGGFIKLQWLNEYYRLLCGNDNIIVQWMARTYILSLLGHVMCRQE